MFEDVVERNQIRLYRAQCDVDWYLQCLWLVTWFQL